MTPDWLNETVRAFGRQIGLGAFVLNERGAAGVRFENGMSLMLEYAAESLLVSVRVPVHPDGEVLRRLLADAHPSVRTGLPQRVRTAYLAKSGEAMYVARIGERQVNVSVIEGAFRTLWGMAMRIGRAA